MKNCEYLIPKSNPEFMYSQYINGANVRKERLAVFLKSSGEPFTGEFQQNSFQVSTKFSSKIFSSKYWCSRNNVFWKWPAINCVLTKYRHIIRNLSSVHFMHLLWCFPNFLMKGNFFFFWKICHDGFSNLLIVLT